MHSLKVANRKLKYFRIEQVEFDYHDQYDVREKSTGKVVESYGVFSVARERAMELEIAREANGNLKLPLRIEDDYIVDADGNDVADCGQSHVRPSDEECATILVNSVNGYAAMREACEAALEYAERCNVEARLTDKLRSALAVEQGGAA